MEEPNKHPALLFCHPSMEDLAKAIAKRCSHTPSSETSDLSASWGKSHLGSGDLTFLQRRISHQRLMCHQPVKFSKTIQWEKFKDGWPNLFIEDVHEIAGRDVIFLGNFQSTDIIFEQLSILYSIPRYLARSFKFILPFFPTGTMERIDTEGKVATAKTLAMLLSAIPSTARGPSQIVIFDIHELQERFYFSDHVGECITSLSQRNDKSTRRYATTLTVAFPDEGALKISHIFEGFRTVICTKVREGDKRIVNVKEGDPKDKHVVIVDDLVQTGGTLKECCKALLSRGARSVSAYVTHAVFPQESWKSFTTAYKEQADPDFRYFWITDSIPHAKDICNHPPFKLISLCDMISEALLGYDLLQ
ncbi:putative ribose-phosphate pyrophosphokinase 4 [Apostichopus japonicus]|uniref:Putative ribose-phosphate pyrophosphokinase 4 n=1 Tax=Stichopus japonicus TaxID=307972 RepID=A0A2G8L2B4_STIJA|nr:putative ribose-phosphate pyrophosphokinase 4 [Apostichopus japonicus]